MNVEETLAMYRQRYGLERMATKQEPDPFEQPQQAGNAPTEEEELFAPNGEYDHAVKEDQREKMLSFARTADTDPILSKDRETMHNAVSQLRGMVADPNNPIDQPKAMEMLSAMLSEMEGSEFKEYGE
ncbi:hypothetical protein [Enterovibrio calviensis]|uniref:hypothetical protein n=1 Tax=Enterovibrio calviensis TaxID=91359 RepID=UPI00048079A2|nr:hypothetical protein [Enterovibrio calviensis]